MQDGKNYSLIDVPDENFTDDHGKPSPARMAGVLSYLKVMRVSAEQRFKCHGGFDWGAVATLEQTIPLQSLRRIVVTHLTPKRLPSLRALLLQKQAAGGPLDIHLSNPALQLLRSSLGDPLSCCMPLSLPSTLMYRPGQSYPAYRGHGRLIWLQRPAILCDEQSTKIIL